MNCTGVIRELSNYIDGDLDPIVKEELEHHLEHCEDCTTIVDQTKKSIEILCDSRPVELPVCWDLLEQSPPYAARHDSRHRVDSVG